MVRTFHCQSYSMHSFPLANLLATLLLATSAWISPLLGQDTLPSMPASEEMTEAASTAETATAVLAGGCFWCVETDFEKLPGVIDVVSGYSGGRTQNPTYETYASAGHREVVLVTYNPSVVSYAGLVEWLVKHIEATNRGGQFVDRGLQYSPAVYYENEEEKSEAERVIKAIEDMKIYRGKIAVAIEPRSPFFPAEDYHQNYHHKNPAKYQFFRLGSGRDAYVFKHWGIRAARLELPGSIPEKSPLKVQLVSQTSQTEDTKQESDESASEKKEAPKPWLTFKKPSTTELRKKLTAIQYKVTQQDGTEPAFRNTYWDNKKDGIYVDVVSGAPLFSSLDKYKSGTGWPSFVKPITENAVFFKADRKLFYTRTEVRSRYGNSHLGHVFDDGPPARGGKRYCMNSAAMRFVPKEDMEKEGYGEFLVLFGETPSGSNSDAASDNVEKKP